MRRNGRERFIGLLWALCIIGTLFSGICFDNAQADSCLAYQDLSSGSIDPIGASAFQAPQKGVPMQQVYVPEGSGQGSSALIPGKTAQRTVSRSVCGSISGLLQTGIIFSANFVGQTALSSDGLCEVMSNTVIVRYIHGQDGEKA